MKGDVSFSLNGTTYQNNSLVTLDDNGDGDAALLCMTNLTGVNRSVRREWHFPNGSRVFTNNSEIRSSGVNGIYHCVIIMNVNQTIYIGVYTSSSGE